MPSRCTPAPSKRGRKKLRPDEAEKLQSCSTRLSPAMIKAIEAASDGNFSDATRRLIEWAWHVNQGKLPPATQYTT